MIKLHRLNKQEILINPDLIEVVEPIPNTSILLTNGNRYTVMESPDEVRQYIIDFKGAIFAFGPLRKQAE